MYRLAPDYRPLFDGRWEVYDQEKLFALYQALSRPADYLRMLAPYGINLYAVDYRLSMNLRLLRYLYRSAEWKLVFADARTVLFLRRVPGNERFAELPQERITDSLKVNPGTVARQNPQSVMNLLILLDEKEAAMDVARRILKAVPGERQVAELYVGYLIQKGRLQAAGKVIDRFFAGEGISAELFSQRAFLRMQQGDLGGALAAMKEAVRLRPGNVGDHFNLALLYLEKGDVKKAKMEVEQVKRLDPGHQGLAVLRERIAVADRKIP